ncbi:MAG TPA: plastocyanin/azurin family copper-binding protein, partial [Nitrososphaeraceae archaeon]|nr:plastocyanin/azurin family copper-binding protein [Nitrososphaeraceae archaeon]
AGQQPPMMGPMMGPMMAGQQPPMMGPMMGMGQGMTMPCMMMAPMMMGNQTMMGMMPCMINPGMMMGGQQPPMMDRKQHRMMMEGGQQQESSKSNFSMPRSTQITADDDNIIYASIVLGAASRTTDAFQPNPIYLKKDQMVVWTNNDRNLHTVTQSPLSLGIDTASRFDSGMLSRGQSFSYIFGKEGTYDYYCTIHPWMVGQVIVVTNSTTVTAYDTNNQSAASISMLERGAVAMGFNQSKILHQFKSTATGGEILITALNNSDLETIKQIKNHISVIQKEFSAGNFTKPFYIHAQDVPGTKLMTEKKNFIKYTINEIDNGSTLILETKDKQLLDAIHQFIAFQGTEHLGH